MVQQNLRGFRRHLIDSLAVAAAFAPGFALANPSGGSVAAGAASIDYSSTPNTVRIDQTSAAAVINWQDFSIGSGEFVQFVHPDATGATLNRVNGGLPSEILGNLTANGRVFIINPQGVMFGATSRVDTAALVATTFDIANDDFMNGRYAFAGDPASTAAVVNQGEIVVTDGGFVVLAGARVSNEKLVQARLGSIALLSGSAMTLSLDDGGLVGYTLDADAMGDSTGAFNSRDLLAHGGQVVMSARVARTMAGQAVNNSGRISARSIQDSEGVIYLSAHGGDIGQIGNVETAGDPGQPGGEILIEADSLAVGAGPAAGCATTVCEGQLESLLGQGTSLGLIARDGLTVAALSDGVLAGSNASGSGGFLLLGIGTNNDGAGYQRGGDGSISFAGTTDQLLLDGGFQAYAGTDSGSLTVGGVLSREFIILEAADDLQAGALTHADGGSDNAHVSLLSQNGGIVSGAIDARNNVYVEAAGDITVNGDIKVVGSIASADPQSFNVVGSRLEILSHGGGITVNGGLEQVGTVDSFGGNSAFAVRGAYAELDAGDGDVLVTGPVSMQGTIGTVTGDVDWSALGTQFSVRASGGVVELRDSITLDGSVGTALGNARLAVRGSEMSLGSAVDEDRTPTTDVIVGGAVTLTGSVGTLFMDNNGQAIGSFFQIGAIGGEARVDGAVSVDGSVGEVGANHSVAAMGGFAELVADGGDIVTGSSFAVSGSVGTAGMDTGLTANGASLLVEQRSGSVLLGGAVQVIGQVDNVGANTAAEVRAADFVIHATGGSIVADGSLYAEGTAGDIGVGSDSFNNGVFIDLQADNDVVLHGDLAAKGSLVSLGAGSGVTAQAAEVQITAQNILGDGSLLMEGITGAVGAGEDVFASGASLTLAADGVIDILGDLGVSGELGDTGTGGNLVARAADLVVHAGGVNLGGEILLVGTTGEVGAADTAFAAGSYLELIADGDITLGGIQAAGDVASVSGGASSSAEATSLQVEAGGVLTVAGDILVDGHNGNAELGSAGSSNGVQLLLKGGSVDLQGGLAVSGLLDAAEGLDSLSAQATSVTIRSDTDLLIAGAITLSGETGTVAAGDSSSVSGSLLDLQAGGSLLIGSGLSVNGMLEAVQGFDPELPPEGVFARATNVSIAAFGGPLEVVGDISLGGSTGSVVAGSNSFSNGVFLGMVATGDLHLYGNLSATANLGSTRAGDFLFAEATEITLVGDSVLVDGGIGLSGSAGLVEGGFDSYAAGSFMSIEATGADVVVLGAIDASGVLGQDSSFQVGGESHAQGLALIFRAPGSIQLGADLLLEGHGSDGSLGYNSFANGSLLDLQANIVRLQGGLSASGTLGDLDSAFGLDAEAADVLIRGLVIDVAGDVMLDGHTGNVRTGNASFISGSFMKLTSSYGVSLGGNLSVDGSLASVSSSDPDGFAADNLFARAANLELLSEVSGAVSIAGNVQLDGSNGAVEAGLSSGSNGVFLQLSAVDQDFNGAGNVVIGGSLSANGHLDSTTAGDGLFARATEIQLLSSGGDIDIGGPVTLTGSNDTVTTGHQSGVSAISVTLDSYLGDILLGSDFRAEGTLGDVHGFSALFARATELNITTDAGSLLAGGSITAIGSTGRVDVTHSTLINATSVHMNLQNGGAEIAGSLDVSGTLDSVGVQDESFARGAELDVQTLGGDFHLGGDLLIDGATGDVAGFDGAPSAFNAVGVNGAYVRLLTVGAGTRIDGDVVMTGTLGSVSLEQFGFASGAEFLALPDGEFRVDGDLRVNGTLGSFKALDDSGTFGADVFVFSGSEGLVGDAVVGGEVEVIGSLESVEAGNNLYSFGAFASFSSLHGDVKLQGPVTVQGSMGSVLSGDNLDLSGAGFWADAKAGSVQLAGPLQISGTVQQVDAANGAFLNGAFAYLTAVGGNLDVNGDLSLQGTMTSVNGDSAIAASGADLLLERSSDVPGGGLTVNGNILEQGSIGSFEVADLESSSRFSGGVLLNANDGSIALRDVTADNAFIYFNQDSSLAQSHLTALEYLEIVTPSGAPTLSADALTITAPRVFVSANIDAGTLAVQGADSLVVSAARLHAEQLSLSSAGLLQLADDSETTGVITEISGGSLQLSGDRVISDAGTLIDAGGLDVVATDTIRLAGTVRVGTGLAQASGDTVLLQQLGNGASELVPLSARPNAYFRASTVALADLELGGDYLHIQADTMRLGTLTLPDGTLVHFDPLNNLPFFTESVDVTDAGLDSVKDRLATENNRVIPNLGQFNDGDSEQELGARPVLNGDRTDQTGDPRFQVGGGVANLGQLVLQTGLANNSVVIGSSDYTAAIQVADQLVVDVLPSTTNFIFATESRILITEPIRTNGRVIILSGSLETDRSTFYSVVTDQINAYYEALEADAADEDDGEVEEKSSDGEECN